MQVIASAHKALSLALSGVDLAAAEQEQLVGRLKAAADKKVADLLQVKSESTDLHEGLTRNYLKQPLMLCPAWGAQVL